MDFSAFFFETTDLCLGDADFLSYFHLRLSFVEAQFYDMLFAAVQPLHSFAESKIFNPAFFFVFFVTDLIHDIKSITAFCIDRFKETHRILDSIKGSIRSFLFDTNFLC